MFKKKNERNEEINSVRVTEMIGMRSKLGMRRGEAGGHVVL